MSILRRLSNTRKAVELGPNESISSLDTLPEGGPYSATATYTINGGVGTYTVSRSGNIISSTTVRWGFRGNYSNYYVRATKLSGDTPSGTLNSWLQTNSNRAWSLSNSTADTTLGCVLRIEISNIASGSVVLDSHEVTIGATCGAPS